MFIRYAAWLIAIALFAGCASNPTTSSNANYSYPYGGGYAAPTAAAEQATQEQTQKLIQAAEATVKQIPIGYEWRFTSKHIKDAKKLLASGKYKNTYLRASRALFEAETALQQSQISQNKWPEFVVK